MKLNSLDAVNNGLPLTAGQLAEILKEFEKQIGAKQIDAMNSAASSIIDFANGIGKQSKADTATLETTTNQLKVEFETLKGQIPEANFKRLTRLIDEQKSAQDLKVNLAIKSIEQSVFGVLSHQPKVIVAADDLNNTLTQVVMGRA
jgi:hypothetical protein